MYSQNVDWNTEQESAESRDNQSGDDHKRCSEQYLNERVFLCGGKEPVQRKHNG